MYAAAVLVCIGSQIKSLIKSMRFPTNFKSTKSLWTTNLSCGRGRYSLAGVLRLLRGQVVKTETWLSNHELNTHRWSLEVTIFNQPVSRPNQMGFCYNDQPLSYISIINYKSETDKAKHHSKCQSQISSAGWAPNGSEPARHCCTACGQCGLNWKNLIFKDYYNPHQ